MYASAHTLARRRRHMPIAQPPFRSPCALAACPLAAVLDDELGATGPAEAEFASASRLRSFSAVYRPCHPMAATTAGSTATATVTAAWPTALAVASTRPARPDAGPAATTVAGSVTAAAVPMPASPTPMSATAPTVPACAATPAKASAICIAAPIKTGAAPAVLIPAVLPAAVDELRLLEGNNRRRRARRRCHPRPLPPLN